MKIKTVIMKHILQLVNYCKNTITSTKPTFYLDLSVSITDLHQKKFVHNKLLLMKLSPKRQGINVGCVEVIVFLQKQ